MKLGVLSAVFVLVAAVPALAGLDFAEEVRVPSASSAIRLNGSDLASFQPLSLPYGFETGNDRLVVTQSDPTSLIQTVTLDFFYYSAFDGSNGFNYSFANGDRYDLVIQMGSISIDQGQGELKLNKVYFSEGQSDQFSDEYLFDMTLTAANSGEVLFLQIPESAIPVSQRDAVDVVRLEFIMVGAGTSFGINAVANPEPGTLALFGLGLAGLAGAVQRRRKRAAQAAQQA